MKKIYKKIKIFTRRMRHWQWPLNFRLPGNQRDGIPEMFQEPPRKILFQTFADTRQNRKWNLVKSWYVWGLICASQINLINHINYTSFPQVRYGKILVWSNDKTKYKRNIIRLNNTNFNGLIQQFFMILEKHYRLLPRYDISLGFSIFMVSNSIIV